MSREEIMDDLQEPQQENYELEEFINEIRKYYKTHEFKRSAINDCVSRQAAMEQCFNGQNKTPEEIAKDIKTLPPAQPEQKKGERE